MKTAEISIFASLVLKYNKENFKQMRFDVKKMQYSDKNGKKCRFIYCLFSYEIIKCKLAKHNKWSDLMFKYLNCLNICFTHKNIAIGN